MLYNWCIETDAVNSQFIDDLVKFVEKNYEFETALVTNPDTPISDHRVAKIAWIGNLSQDAGLRNMVWNFAQRANRDGFGFDLQYVPGIQYTVYEGTTQGHYDWHTDMSFVSTQPYCRKLSFILQLSDSDEYEGGDVEIEPDFNGGDLNRDELRQKGTVLIFPSFVRHRVTPVTKGTRRSLVSWIEGPQFR